MDARRAEMLASKPRLGSQQPAPERGTHRNGNFHFTMSLVVAQVSDVPMC